MLRYFATNRAIDQLGRAVDQREDRLTLQKGGYYFVDMDQYMRFYLGTLETEEMSGKAIVKNSSQGVFDDFLKDPRVGKIVVCVHGFNVELFEAFTWFRILTNTMKHMDDAGCRIVTAPGDLAELGDAEPESLTGFIGFSWPSNGNVLSYPSDQREAVRSASAFASLLGRLKATGKSINLICHSMGNYLACHTFAALVNKEVVPPAFVDQADLRNLLERGEKSDDEEIVRDGYLIDRFVMIAPDVERRHVTKSWGEGQETEYVGPFYSGLQHLVKSKLNVYSRFDAALAVSDVEKRPREALLAAGDAVSKLSFGLLDFLERNPDQKWEKRLGEAPAPVNAAPGFTSLNATEIAGRKIDHSDHIDAQPIAGEIMKALEV